MKSSRRWKKSSPKPEHLRKKAVYGATLSGYTVSYIPIVLRNDVAYATEFFIVWY